VLRHIECGLISTMPQCGADMIAPEWSEHVPAHCIRNVVLRGQVISITRMHHRRASVMDSEVTGQAGCNEEILTFDVPDDALERAATAEQKAHTWIYCTYAWYNCGWPQ